ncbi:MAG: hypothetical protein QOI95_79 [Acidimicrobiaceae bacterium]|jgi:DNA-binding HxlR family transcriptional regulator
MTSGPDPIVGLTSASTLSGQDIEKLLALLGKRWVLEVIARLQAGPLRRHVLRSALQPVSDKVLTAVLRDLEAAGIVTHTITASVPARVDYDLTARGRALAQPLAAFAAWCRTSIENPTRLH